MSALLAITATLAMTVSLSGAGIEPLPPGDPLRTYYDDHPQKLLDDLCSQTKELWGRLRSEKVDEQTNIDIGNILGLACYQLHPSPRPK
jgi:hypothetical protein